MSARPFHKRYHSDALAGFMALTLEERGAYQTLLDMIYDRQGPLIDNERLLAGYMGVSIRKWKTLRETLIAKGKIYLTEDGLIHNARAKKEIENDAKTSRKLSENGSKGGRKKYENAKKTNENSEGGQAGLEQNSSLYHIPYSRDHIEPPSPQEAKPSEEGQQRPATHYEFEGRTVRLNKRDFDRWAQAFHAIPDLRAKLQVLDDWLQRPETPEVKRKGWFNLVSRSLSREHEEALASKRADDAEHAAFLRRHPERTFTEDEARALMTDVEFESWKRRQSK